MYGFWNNKRIVLYDTLIANYHAKKEGDTVVASTTETTSPVSDKSETAEDSNGDWEKPNIVSTL